MPDNKENNQDTFSDIENIRLRGSIPETILAEQVIDAAMQQKVIEFRMFVPGRKPDIEQVIDVYVKDLAVTNINVIKDKVIIRGEFEVKVMYVADLFNQPVHAFEKKHIHWTRDIPIDGIDAGMNATADVAAEYINYDFDCEEPRQVDITVVLKVWSRVISTVKMDILGDAGATQINQFDALSAKVDSPGAATIYKTAVVNANNVNVRTGPGTNFPSTGKTNKGITVTLKEQAFGWYKVVLPDGNTTGWIAGWLLDIKNITD